MQVTLTYLMTIPLFESNDKLTLDDQGQPPEGVLEKGVIFLQPTSL